MIEVLRFGSFSAGAEHAVALQAGEDAPGHAPGFVSLGRVAAAELAGGVHERTLPFCAAHLMKVGVRASCALVFMMSLTQQTSNSFGMRLA